jgi:hypothetical protein
MDKNQIVQKGFATKFKIKRMQQLLKLKPFFVFAFQIKRNYINLVKFTSTPQGVIFLRTHTKT